MAEDDKPRDVSETVLSFVVPVHNEADVLPTFYQRLRAAAEKLGEPYETIFVNDGSTDGSLETIRRFAADDEHVRCLDLSRNFGHQEALTAGYDFAAGKAVVCLDADCQHPPEMIDELVGRWRQGYEVVYTVKNADPNVSRLRRLAVRATYRLIRWLSGMDVADQADFRLLDWKVVRAIRQVREKSRFLRGLVRWVGFRQVAVPYDPAPREAGRPSYTLGKLAKIGSAGVLNFSLAPLRCLAVLGTAMVGAALAYAIVALVLWPFVGASAAASLVMLLIGLSGLQVGATGLVGEYIGRTYEEAKNRPIYVLREALGFDVEGRQANPPPAQPARQAPPLTPGRIRLFT